jgi:asparagine synthase (glutamine-hydrolysing)
MPLIGGLVFWDPDRTVTVADLKPMATRVPGIGPVHYWTDGRVGFFWSMERSNVRTFEPSTFGSTEPSILRSFERSTFGPTEPSNLRTFERVSVVADLDLTNLEEMHALAREARDQAELVAALYAGEGSGFVQRVHGALAVAIWDRRERLLHLAVDRFGIKRLHYVSDGHRTAFATRPSAVLGVPGVEKRVDPTQVYNYLNFGFVPSPASIFAGIRRLPPGCMLIADGCGTRLERYWDMAYPEAPLRKRAAATQLYRVSEAAIAEAVRGIQPKEAGSFLSGGTDSSTVVGLMGRVTGERPNAFSIGFREERYDELAYAELAARHFGATHYKRTVTADEALAALPRLVEAYDEPFGNNSAIGTYFCAELARECGVAWLMAGDGGDEIFGGNERYRADRMFALYHTLPAAVRRAVIEPVLFALPKGDDGIVGQAQRYVRRANIPNPRRFYSYEFFVAQHAPELLDREFLAAVEAGAPYAVVQGHYDAARAQMELNCLLYLDLKLTIGDNDLLKVTRTAELAGVSVRFPLLDRALVEFTGTLPAHFKVRGLEKRYLFKRAFRELLPRETLAKRKHGFGVPTSDWLKRHTGFRDLARDALASSRARQRAYFRAGAIEELLRLHAADTTPFYGDILWTVLMLELWHRRHVDGESGSDNSILSGISNGQ